MGQADVNVNLWLKDTKRFADLFNAILFQGKAVILPENLYPSPETTAVSLQDTQGKNVVKKQYRDIIMNWQDQAVLMLLAVCGVLYLNHITLVNVLGIVLLSLALFSERIEAFFDRGR